MPFGDATHDNTQTFKSTTSFKTFSPSLHFHYMPYLLGERKKGASSRIKMPIY